MEDRCLLAASSHGLCSAEGKKRERELSGSLVIWTPILLDQSLNLMTPFKLTSSEVPHLDTDILGVRASTYEF